MQTTIFSSDQLPCHLSDKHKFGLWCDQYVANVAGVEIQRSEAPFQAHIAYNEFGSVRLGRTSASVTHGGHAGARSSSATQDYFSLMINEGEGEAHVRSGARECVLAPGAAALLWSIQPERYTTNESHAAWTMLRLPGERMLRAVPGSEDLVGGAVPAASDALRTLRGYAQLALQGKPTDTRLQAHIEQTLADLMALALDAGKDAAEIAGRRGLKAARLESIVQAIADGYCDPEFSVARVARKLRVSERYIQDVLHGTDKSFSERVMELRLQHAAGLLSRAADRTRKVSDIAFSSGFNDLSYFHRCYRRRFGMTPAGARVH